MAEIPGATLTADKTQVTFSICVEIERIEGVNGTAMGDVTIGGVSVWQGYVQWDERPMTFDNGVVLDGPVIARQRAAREAIQKWTGRW